MKTKTINNPIEHGIDRDEVVWNHNSGSLVFDNTTGKQRVHLTHRSGANWYMNDKVVSTFSPNDLQELARGNVYKTSTGDTFIQSQKNSEHRTYGDFRIITGSPNFFDNPIADDYIENNRDLATAKASPEIDCGGIGNNSGAVFEDKGTPEEKSGAVEGGSYPKSEAQKNVQTLMESKAESNTGIEQLMGEGGNISMMSCKHITLIAGTAAVNYDSGVTISNGRAVKQRTKYVEGDGGARSIESVMTAVPVYESKDTSSAMPFGDIQFKAAAKLNMAAGSGGMKLTSSGDIDITSTGRLELGGSEVAIGGSTKGSGGRVTIVTDKDIFIESGDLITQHAPYINLTADSWVTLETPQVLLTKDCHIQGDLNIQGNLHVQGDIVCNGSTGITVPNGDVVASGISLVNHVHGGISGGPGKTAPPE